MRALILAAGRGERMRPLTNDLPKPLLPAGGQPLIDYHIRALARAGIRELVVNLSWHGEKLRSYLGDGRRHGVTFAFSEEGPEPLETGGGIHHALPLLGPGAFWVVNGDIACDFRYTQRSLPAGTLAHLVLVPNPAHNPRGDFLLAGGRVSADPPGPVTGTTAHRTFAGISVLDPRLFAGASPGKFPLAPLLRAAAARGEVSGEEHLGRWTDVGTPERLEALDAELNSRV
ncbi:MAG: nucleotidyltransferase family protein [Chromatiales bacterium]|nr:nucleotidyltransferase family protein [Chromatiales bacterium]